MPAPTPQDAGSGIAEIVTLVTSKVADLPKVSDKRIALVEELTTLLHDIAAGRVVPKVYRQFKMYNDPQYRGTDSTRRR